MAFLLLLFASSIPGCSGREPGPLNLVLIVIDTARADRFSCYGYDRLTTPRIDALCERGVRFENAASTSSWTVSAHASIFTGLFPIQHGATQEYNRLEAGAATLAEILRSRGYATFGASANPLVGARTGMARGFEHFSDTWRQARRGRPSSPDRHPNLRAVESFLVGLSPHRPFFLFVNYIEPHGPYVPPEPYRSRFLRGDPAPELVSAALAVRVQDYYLDRGRLSSEQLAALSDLYDGEIAYADALVGALIERLERAGRLADTVIVITSDHGENLGEHGHIRHVFSLYNTTVRVPLIVLLPEGRRAGERRPEPVSLVDLFVTLLSELGLEAPEAQRQGRNILAPAELASEAPRFAEYYFPRQVLLRFPAAHLARHRQRLQPYLRRLRSVELGDLRWIWSSDGRHELFDLSRDPQERFDQAGAPELAERERELRELLADFVERRGRAAPLLSEAPAQVEDLPAFEGLDPEEREELRSLGYLP